MHIHDKQLLAPSFSYVDETSKLSRPRRGLEVKGHGVEDRRGFRGESHLSSLCQSPAGSG